MFAALTSAVYIQVCASMYLIESDGGGLDEEMCKERSFLTTASVIEVHWVSVLFYLPLMKLI